MSKIKIFLFVIITALLVFSCKTTTANTNDSTQTPPSGAANTGTNNFDPTKVSQAQYTATRDEVKLFIEKLNQIVKSKDYNAWRGTLSQEYINEYSSPERLQEISEMPYMKQQKIVLRSLNDYFLRVFVPSRNPDRIQSDINNIQIEFVTAARVRAFITRTNSAGEESREILYSLEKINNEWKIIN